MIRSKKTTHTVFLIILTSFLFSAWNVASGQESPLALIREHGELRTATDQDALWFLEESDAVVRFQDVVLNEELTTGSVTRTGDIFAVHLFPDIRVDAIIERQYTNISGTFVLRARIDTPGGGYLVLSNSGHRSLVTMVLHGSDSFFRITGDPVSGQYFVMEFDTSLIVEPPHSPSLIPPPITPDEKSEQERIRNRLKDMDKEPDDEAYVDVLVVYTPAASDWAAMNEGGIENTVAHAMEVAQLVADMSNVQMHFRLVYSRMVNYTESSSAGVDLQRITAGPHFNPFGNQSNGETIPGFMDEVHEWRNKYSADLVSIFPLRNDVGGVAWLLTDRLGRPNYGFSLTRVQQASSTYTHIHEMGHNMGAHHHKEQNFQPGPTNWVNWPDNIWSAGWRWRDDHGIYYTTVMSYDGGQYYPDGTNASRVPYFSSPEVYHQEHPTGHPQDGDNARTLRELRHVIASYRVAAMNVVEGKVLDYHSNPIGGARIEVSGQGALMFTRDDGSFSIPFLPDGDYDLVITKEEYHPLVEEIQIIGGQTLQLDLVMFPMQNVTISGFVAPKEDMENGFDGALLRFKTGSDVYTITTEQGEFLLEHVPGGTSYELLITYPGYEVYHTTFFMSMTDDTLESIYLPKAFKPVEGIRSAETDEYIDIFWETPSFTGDFRYDAGAPTGGLGYTSAPNSLMGGAYRRHAWIERIRWHSTAGSETKANLYILELNPEGIPNRQNVLYAATGIDNHPGQWNSHELPHLVQTPYGFFIGVGAHGSFSLVTDEQNFQPHTNFITAQMNQNVFTDLADTEYHRNFYIRAEGYDFGPWMREDKNPAQASTAWGTLEDSFFNQDAYNEPGAFPPSKYETQDPVAYNIYLDDFEEVFAGNITETAYRFTGLPHGRYYAGVQAVYPDGLSEIHVQKVFSGIPEYILTLAANPDNGGVTIRQGLYPEGTIIDIEAIPYAGYKFLRWVNEEEEELSRKPVYSFEMPKADTQLTALFYMDPMGIADIKVFPNPARNRINIVAEHDILEVRMIDTMGQVMYSRKNHNHPIYRFNVSGMRDGMYILQIRTSEQWLHERIQLISP